MDDNQIVELYWQRDETAIEETAQKFGSYCHSIAYNILGNHEDAEECTNNTYLNAWNAIPPTRPGRLSTFLGKITRNLSFDVFKQYHAKKRGGGQVELALNELEECIPSPDPTTQAIDELELTESLNRFLRGLPASKRKIFLLRYWYVLPVREIALQCGSSESNISSTLFRVRKELKLHLEKEEILL